jgi:putative peptidoglycan lipid II flippase
MGPARPIKAPAPNRDRTPTGGSPRGVPAKQFQQRRAPSVFVVTLLIIALIVAIVLWAINGSDSPGGDAVGPADTVATTTTTLAPSGPISVVAVTSFDPGDPDGGLEKPELVDQAIDGSSSTAWTTNCYNDKYFNGKPGVGLVVQLSAPSTGAATIDVESAPYQLDVYTSDAEVAPTTMDGWTTQVLDRAFDDVSGTVVANISDARFVLVLLREAGRDNGCSDRFPYRGSIGEITVAAG